jgi:hypothetical protein
MGELSIIFFLGLPEERDVRVDRSGGECGCGRGVSLFGADRTEEKRNRNRRLLGCLRLFSFFAEWKGWRVEGREREGGKKGQREQKLMCGNADLL